MNDKKYLTIKEAADYLGLHWQTIRNYLHQDKLPYLKIGRTYRIDVDDLEKLKDKPQKQPDKIEIERRFWIDNRDETETRLREKGARLANHVHVVDHWFVPYHIKNLKDNLEFIEGSRGFTLRVRETKDFYSERTITTVEVKKILGEADHGYCFEEEMLVQEYAEARNLLEVLNFKEVLIIDKERIVYSLPPFKIALDTIVDLGVGIELEHTEATESAQAEQEILEFVAELDIPKESMVEKSLTYFAMRDLADFTV